MTNSIPKTLEEAIALDIEPTDPGTLDAYRSVRGPGYLLYNVQTGDTVSLEPEDHRWAYNETDEELRSSMELAVESAWHDGINNGQQVVLVPAHLVPGTFEQREGVTW